MGGILVQEEDNSVLQSFTFETVTESSIADTANDTVSYTHLTLPTSNGV